MLENSVRSQIEGHNQHIERWYDNGVIGSRNTIGLNIDRFETKNSDEAPNILYVHPSEVPYSHGDVAQIRYGGSGTYGGFRDRNISNTGIMGVTDQIPENLHYKILEGSEWDCQDVTSLLIGEKDDRALEETGARVQAIPGYMV